MTEITGLTTRSGIELHVRPATLEDEAELAEFFSHVSVDDLRFRFLTSLSKVRHEQLVAMLAVDHRQTETVLAFDADDGLLIAVAMLAGDGESSAAEVAISVRSDYKHKGVSWTLLDHVSRLAETLGFQSLISIESRANYEAIELEREKGFSVSQYPDDPALVMVRRDLDTSTRGAMS